MTNSFVNFQNTSVLCIRQDALGKMGEVETRGGSNVVIKSFEYSKIVNIS